MNPQLSGFPTYCDTSSVRAKGIIIDCVLSAQVIKTRLAVSQTGQFKGILDCGIKVVQQSGPLALFRGYLPNLIGIIPYAGIDLTIYEVRFHIDYAAIKGMSFRHVDDKF